MKKMIRFHKPDEEYGFLSNWYLSEFEVTGKKFTSVEQYMMYSKATVFGDDEVAKKIMESDDVAEIKRLGRQVKGYNESVWNGIRQIVVYYGLVAKFKQNEELRQRLIETGNTVLVECAIHDCVWGNGLGMNDKNVDVVDRWRGQNLLGYTLMMVREVLRDNNET